MTERNMAIVFAEGYTGMTLMQELASQQNTLPFQKYTAIIDKQREAEGSDISRMNEKFTIRPYDSKDMDSIKRVLQEENFDTLVIIPPAQQNKAMCCEKVLDACKTKSSLKNILMVSSILTEECCNDQELFNEFKDLEDMLLSCKCERVCIMRAGFYCQNLLLYTAQIQSGELPLPAGDARLNMIDLADVGVAMAQVLRDMGQADNKHHRQIYNLLGMEMLNGLQLAEKLSTHLQMAIKFKDISLNEAQAILSKSFLIDAYESQYLLSFYNLLKQGKLNSLMEQACTQEKNDFLKLTGMPPTTVDEFMSKYVTEFKTPTPSYQQVRSQMEE